MPLAVGLGIITLVGLASVIVYLIVRRRDPVTGQLGDGVVAQQPQVYLINAGGGQAQVVRAEPVAAAPANEGASAALERIESRMGSLFNFFTQRKQSATPATMRTYQLPWLGDQNNPAIRIATAGAEPYEVTVRVVSPPGGLAALSFSPNELNLTQSIVGPNMSAVPTGDTLIIPSGQKHNVFMNPRQALYARGNFSPSNPNGAVVLSITAGDYYNGR